MAECWIEGVVQLAEFNKLVASLEDRSAHPTAGVLRSSTSLEYHSVTSMIVELMLIISIYSLESKDRRDQMWHFEDWSKLSATLEKMQPCHSLRFARGASHNKLAKTGLYLFSQAVNDHVHGKFNSIIHAWVWFPVCPLWEATFNGILQSAACSLSAVRRSRESTRGRLLIHYRYSTFNWWYGYISSFIERWSAGGRVRYGRFHCTFKW